MHHNRTDFSAAAFKSNNKKSLQGEVTNQKSKRQRRFEDKVLREPETQQQTPGTQKSGGGKQGKNFLGSAWPRFKCLFLAKPKQTQICLACEGNVPLDLKQNILLQTLVSKGPGGFFTPLLLLYSLVPCAVMLLNLSWIRGPCNLSRITRWKENQAFSPLVFRFYFCPFVVSLQIWMSFCHYSQH